MEFPVQSRGLDDGTKPTCSAPSATNRGCPYYGVCEEKSRGQHPVNVFAVDRLGNAVTWQHCVRWYEDGLNDRVVGGQRRFVRITRPERIKVQVAAGAFGTPEGGQVKVIEVAPPPEALLGDTGSNRYTGPTMLDFDMLGPELRKELGLSADPRDDEPIPGLTAEGGSLSVLRPVPVELYAKAAAAQRAQG